MLPMTDSPQAASASSCSHGATLGSAGLETQVFFVLIVFLNIIYDIYIYHIYIKIYKLYIHVININIIIHTYTYLYIHIITYMCTGINLMY
jgi:hypothetical protein